MKRLLVLLWIAPTVALAASTLDGTWKTKADSLLKRIDANTIEETDRRDGKVTDIIRITVSADGRSLSVVDTDPVRNIKMTYTMMKQP